MKRQLMRLRLVTLAAIATGITVAMTPYFAARGQTFTDDFNDGNDAGWTHYDVLQPFGFGATYSFPGGNSYKIDVPGNYTVPQIERGRSGSVVTGSNYTDFRLTLDITDWNDTREYVFGPIARGKEFGLGTTDGYLLILNAADHDFQLLRVEN